MAQCLGYAVRFKVAEKKLFAPCAAVDCFTSLQRREGSTDHGKFLHTLACLLLESRYHTRPYRTEQTPALILVRVLYQHLIGCSRFTTYGAPPRNLLG